jgi:hypothetical protein
VGWIALATFLCAAIHLRAIHLGAILLAAVRFGLLIRRIKSNWGSTLLRIGKLRIKPLASGCRVRLKYTESEWLEGDAKRDALDIQPRATRSRVTAVCPCALPVLLGMALRGCWP